MKDEKEFKEDGVVDTPDKKSGKRGKRWNNKAGKGKYGSGRAIKIEKYNDATWYAKNQYMLSDAASYSYNNPLGTITDMQSLFPQGSSYITELTEATRKGGQRYCAVPGLLTFLINLSIGNSTDSTSPANLAAQNIYSFVRYKNSGAKNYDQADLMLYLLAMDSIYSLWNHMKRAYGLLMQYSQYNRYMPEAYFYACGLDFNDFQNGIADYRLALNRFAAQITSFAVPGVMTYFVRHSWMFSNVYKDSNNLKAQQYMYVPNLFYKFSETESRYGGSLIAKAMPNASQNPEYRWGWRKLASLMQELLDAVAYSEDIGVMSGDILKAYGEGALIKLSPVEADYTVTPVYVEEVLNQMHNSNIAPIVNYAPDAKEEINSQKITQDPNTGYLVWKPPIDKGQLLDKIILNMPWDTVTPANTMVGSRLTASAALKFGSTTEYYPIVGSEYVINRQIIFFMKDATGKVRLGYAQHMGNFYLLSTTVDSTGIASGVEQTLFAGSFAVDLISNFDWHPIVPKLIELRFKSGSGSPPVQAWTTTLMGDFSNYTYITNHNLENMHLTALMSEFNIPQEGTF